MRRLFYIILVGLLLSSTSASSSSNEPLKTNPKTNSPEPICKSPAVYAGNYVTGHIYKYKIGDKTYSEIYDYRIIPTKYKWVDGAQKGTSIEYKIFPPKYETITEVVSIAVKTCPPKYMGIYEDCNESSKSATKNTYKQVLMEPLRIEACEVPLLYKDGKTRIVLEPSKVKRYVTPSYNE